MLKLLRTIKEYEQVADAYPFGEYHHVVMKTGGIKELQHYLNKKQTPAELKEVQPDIEDCFIALMKD